MVTDTTSDSRSCTKKSFFTLSGLYYGLAIIAIFIPLRFISVVASIKVFIKDFWYDRYKISISLMPNLIFGLVIIGILKDRFSVNEALLSGLVIYTLVSSILPAIFFEKMPPEDYDLSRG